MLTPTHLVTAQTAYLSACIFAGHQPQPVEAIAALGGALIPDLDSKSSYVGRVLPPVSEWIEHQFGHRTITHSAAAQIIVGALLWWMSPWGAIATLSGWISHSLADMMTPSGVVWFWPARGRCVLPANPAYRINVGSRGELGVIVTVAVIGIVLAPLAETGRGTTGLIRAAIGDISAARQEYDAKKGSRAFSLSVSGRDNRSMAEVEGTYPVIGPAGDAGLLLDTPDGPRTVCRSSACDWYASSAVLVDGEPEETTTRQIEAGHITARALLDALRPLEVAGQVYLIGEVEGHRLAPSPPVIETTDGQARLWYATPEDLEKWNRQTLRRVTITIQVRHTPGVSVPGVHIASTTEDGIQEPLRTWVERSKRHNLSQMGI